MEHKTEILGIIWTIFLTIVLIFAVFMLGGCETKKPINTGIDSPYSAPNICLKPENQGTQICPSRN